SRLYRGLGSADFCRLQKGIPPSELRASRPRHHASEMDHATDHPDRLAISRPLQIRNGPRTRPLGDYLIPSRVRGSPAESQINVTHLVALFDPSSLGHPLPLLSCFKSAAGGSWHL